MSAAPDIAIRIEGARKTFDGGLHAFGPIDADILRGARVGLIGPSGCGKSTLLRCIAGLEALSDGAVAFAETPAPGDIGFVFQDPVLPPWARLRDVVALPLRLAGELDDGARTQAALALVGLEDFADAYPRQLSGGMRMRASLARAIITQPDYLFLDEPFAALDEITRWELNAELLHLADTQPAERRLIPASADPATLIFVTHSVFEAVFLCDQILVFGPRPGRIVRIIETPRADRRDPEFRLSTPYLQTCKDVSDALADAMRRESHQDREA